MPGWFYDLPIYVASVMMLMVCNAVSLLGYWFYTRDLIRIDNREIVTKVVWQTVLYFSTVFIAFWIVTTWNNLGDLKQTTIREANTVAMLYHDLNSLPIEQRTMLEKKLLVYLDSVVNDEYKSLASGHENQATNSNYNQLASAIYNYQPDVTLASELRYNRILLHLSQLSDYREERLSYLDGSLSGPMLIFFLTMIMVGCFWTGFIETRSFRFTLFIIISQNLIMGSSSWLILEMDKPFEGQFSVTNAPFVMIQKEINLTATTIANNKSNVSTYK